MSDSTHQKRKFSREIFRKMIHLLEIPVLIGYSMIRFAFDGKVASLALTVVLIILLEIEYIRLEYRLKLPHPYNILRRHEKDHLAGNIFFISATIISFASYNYEVALLALTMAVFGDFASALVGIKYGRTRLYKNKTLEGTLSGFIVNLCVGYIFFPSQPFVFVSMAFTATLVELYTGKLDDNLTVPLASGFVGELLFNILAISSASVLGPHISALLRLLWN